MKRIIATVGPSLLHTTPITKVHKDAYIYRINGAHGTIADIEAYIDEIRSQVPDADILMDLPGNKVRTANLEPALEIDFDKKFTLTPENFNYPDFYKHLSIGDIVWANDSTFQFLVDSIKDKNITFISKSKGTLLSNKGMHVRGIHAGIPFFFKKDKDLIELANRKKLSHVGLSFVRTGEDVKEAIGLIDKGITIISKVETKAAVENINDILDLVEHILVDRGDLSTEIGMAKLASYQEYIIDMALFRNKKIFLATQFLKNMELNPVPAIAEVLSMYDTLKSGVYGLQLSEETAVGKYPAECLKFIEDMSKEIYDNIVN